LRFLIQAALRPGWLDGNFTNVGSLGSVVHTFRDGTEAEVRANSALAFGSEYQSGRLRKQRRRRDPGIGDGLTISGRRLLADGEGQVRLEVVVRDVLAGISAIGDRLDELLTSTVYVVREGQTELISAGFYVARLYLSQSEKTIFPHSPATTTRLLQEGSGSPFVLVMHPQPSDGNADGIPLETVPADFEAVTCSLVELAGKTTGVWQIWGAGPQLTWLPTARMLCRIICQLSEVSSVIGLQHDPQALAPHLLDKDALDHFFRVRAGQLRRKMQGGWSVPEVQRLAAQHLSATLNEESLSRDSLASFLRRDVAGDVAVTMGRVKRDSDENMMMKGSDRELLAGILAMQALNQQEYFRNLIIKSDLPIALKQQRQNKWSDDDQVNAFSLIDWALSKGINTNDPKYTVLASLLLSELKNLGDDVPTIVAMVFKYRLIRDEPTLNDFLSRYNCPDYSNYRSGDSGQEPVAADRSVGPDIVWRGPTDSIELQSWLQRTPPDFLDVGYLRQAIKQAASVCLVEVDGGAQTGTGVVYDDQYVLTNYHVVESAMGPDGPLPEAKAIRLKFGGYSDGAPLPTIPVDETKPIIAWSKADKLDYALLKVPALASLPDVLPAQRSSQVPALRSSLSILQHPSGGDMKLAPSIDAITFRDPDTGIIQYVTRAASGSSGSPCFDDNWKLVAIHHAERSRPFGTIREGILISSIEKDIVQWFKLPADTGKDLDDGTQN
jgi:hypothetical protein